MRSIIEDFAFIARRAHEIRMARYQELGVCPPRSPESPPPPAEEKAPPQGGTGGFRYAPGFEHLAQRSPIDDTG
jgi:hypothetical protein